MSIFKDKRAQNWPNLFVFKFWKDRPHSCTVSHAHARYEWIWQQFLRSDMEQIHWWLAGWPDRTDSNIPAKFAGTICPIHLMAWGLHLRNVWQRSVILLKCIIVNKSWVSMSPHIFYVGTYLRKVWQMSPWPFEIQHCLHCNLLLAIMYLNRKPGFSWEEWATINYPGYIVNCKVIRPHYAIPVLSHLLVYWYNTEFLIL